MTCEVPSCPYLHPLDLMFSSVCMTLPSPPFPRPCDLSLRSRPRPRPHALSLILLPPCRRPYASTLMISPSTSCILCLGIMFSLSCPLPRPTRPHVLAIDRMPSPPPRPHALYLTLLSPSPPWLFPHALVLMILFPSFPHLFALSLMFSSSTSCIPLPILVCMF